MHEIDEICSNLELALNNAACLCDIDTTELHTYIPTYL